jgi:hypothetical protein
MNALVKKEVRLLLPSFLASLLMALAVWLLPNHLDHRSDFAPILAISWFLSCPAMLAMMTLGAFGREFSSGTFSMLLAQPVPRARIWSAKVLPLAVMVALVWFIWCISYMLHNPDNRPYSELRDFVIFTALYALAIYSGGLWSVLLFRQVAAGFWFAVLTPAALLMTIAYFLDNQPDKIVEWVIITVFTVYGIVGFFFARRLFLQAQDVAWTGRNITMPEMRGLAWFKIGSGVRRDWRPRASLLLKEFQLHQGQYIMAGVLALLHLGVIATRKFGNIQKNSTTEFVLESFWMLWLVMPFLVGCAAVAEERKMGTLEGQLCLPVKRRTQFGLKLFVVIVLSVVLGTIMPLLLEGTRILPEYKLGFAWDVLHGNIVAFSMWGQLGLEFLAAILFKLPLLTLVAFSISLAAIAFYASTLTRNTLQALAPAVLGILAAWLLIFAALVPEMFVNFRLWRGPLVYLIGMPVMLIVLAILAFRNYKRVLIGWSVWQRNLLTIVVSLALVSAATTAIYHRAWEKLTLFEPQHGAARLSLSNPPVLSDQWSTFFVRMPDRRIWTDDYELNTRALNPLALVLSNIRLTSLDVGRFCSGSNWVNVVRGTRSELAGIKTDGTLCVSEKPAHRERLAGGGWKMSKAGDLVRFGSETNWSSIVDLNWAMLLIKNDGTLWRWGIVTNWSWKKEWPGLQSFTPYRLGTESNWVKAFLADNQPCLRKADGSVWTTRLTGGKNQQTNELELGFRVERAPIFEHGKWRSTAAIWDGGLSYHLGVGDDGVLRIWADQKFNNQSHSYEWTAVDLQFGKDTNWLAVAGHYGKIVTLKDDGSLWLWNFYHDYRRGWNPERDEREMLKVKPIRLGTHSDWLAVASADGGIISLAADGSLWYWPLEEAGYFISEMGRYNNNTGNFYFVPLLDISRKPQFLGNVFGKAD